MSTAAILVYPDFFKVAYSQAGNHDNTMYNSWWAETHYGVKEKENKEGEVEWIIDIDKNPSLAKNLKGKLFLVTGDIDNNCLLYTSPSPRDGLLSRMPSSA